MGAFVAKHAEEKAELNAGRQRAQRFLQGSSPTYIEDIEYLGLQEDDGQSTTFSGEIPRSDSKSEAFDSGTDEEGLRASYASGGSAAGSTIFAEAAEGAKRGMNDRVLRDHGKLLDCAYHGGILNRWAVQRLVGKPHVHVDHRDKKGRSALFLAAERGHRDIMQVLVYGRAKIDIATSAQWTPLHAATFHGQMRCMEFLLLNGANIRAKDIHGCTPLMLAASSPKLFIVDLVSAADRRRRRHVREAAYRQQMRVNERARKKGKGEIKDPKEVWKQHPNKIELLVMGILLKTSTHGVKIDQLVNDYDKKRRTSLIYAARYGRDFAMSRLLHAKANLHHQDNEGRTALFHATQNGHIETVEMLIRAGANVNQADQYVVTPLHIALQIADDAMANLLLEARASVQAVDCEGRSAIMISMDTHNRKMFALLVERRSNLNVVDRRGYNVVMYAVETGMIGEVLPLLANGGERVKDVLRLYDPQGRNTLHHAAQHEDLQQAMHCVEALIRLDPEGIVQRDCNGDTAIHMAAERGRLDVLRLMITAVGPVNFRNNRGETPLMYAAHGGHLASVIALVQGPEPFCDAGMVDEEGKTLLMHACASGHLDLVNVLLQNREGKHEDLHFPKMDVNRPDHHGTTALMVAVGEGHWQLLPSLVLAGANKAAKDADGFTALHIAALEDEPLCAASLLDLNLDPNVQDGRGWTPLMHAAWRGSDDVVRLLVDAGCNLDARNWDGDTALQICLRRKDRHLKVTLNLLTDGILSRGQLTTNTVQARGHFMVTVVGSKDLYHEGKADRINAYVFLEFRHRQNITPQVAYTTCVLKEGSPQWHEGFRFDVDQLDPCSYLMAWVISAPGDDFDDIVRGMEFGMDEQQLRQAAVRRVMRGEKVEQRLKQKVDFSMGIDRTLDLARTKRQMDKEERERQHRRLEDVESGKAPMSTLQRHRLPYQERRWNEVQNMRQVLERTGVSVSEPLVPRCHLPLGCFVARFRHLRDAVWGTEPVVLDRMLRIAPRGKLRIEIDFRPTYFVGHDPGKAEHEEDKLRTPRLDDLEETAESMPMLGDRRLQSRQAPTATTRMNFPMLSAPPRGDRKNPVELYRRFVQVSVWSKQVLDARRRATEDEFAADREAWAGRAAMLKSAYETVTKPYKAILKQRAVRERQLDRRIEAPTHHSRKGAAASVPATVDGSTVPLAKSMVPALRIEPWLEEILDGSRLY